MAGDILLSVAGTEIKSRDDVAKAISGNKPGDKVEVKFSRNGQEMTVEITLGRG